MPGSGTPVIQVSRNFDIRDRIITETDDPFYSFAALNGSSSGYDSVGNLTYYQDLVIGNWNYNYDTLNRLTTAQNTATTSIAPQYINAVGCWTYDGFGNRTLETFNNAPTPCASGPNGNLQRTVTTPTSSNQVSGFTYDLAGNVLYDNLDANYYRYDAEGRLCAVGYPSGSGGTLYEQYLYDASGARIGKGTLTSLPSSCNAPTSANQFTSTLQYLVGPGGEQVTELNSSSGEVQHTNVFTGGKLLATYDFSGNAPNGLHFALADPLGTMRVQVTPTGPGTGETELSCMSLPFGNDLGNPRVTNCLGPGTDATEHHLTGKERDSESGNDYFGAMYYASSMGRFMSPDPMYLEMHRLADPQQLNLYAYARNNPLTVTDPTGLDITCGGTRCADYLSALQKDVSFKIDYDKNGKVETVGDIDKKDLSKSDKQFLKAIDDTKNHVTINAIDGGKDSSVFFGRSDGNHTGTHTIAFDQAGLLDSPKNAGGMTSAGLIGHETLEGYGESQGWGFEASHNWATGLGFPGLDPGRITGLYGNAQTGMAFGFTQQFQVHGTGTTENMRINFVSPIPAASVHSGMNAAGYPVSVEKPK